MRQGKGTPAGKFGRITGIATKKGVPAGLRHRHVYVGEKPGFHSLGYAGCVFSGSGRGFLQPGAIGNADISGISDGDILTLDDRGHYDFVWEEGSPHNVFFLTGKCNVACRMCPQPPNDADETAYEDAARILELLLGRELSEICITGGEPTMFRDKFLRFLDNCAAQHPEARISILTNGRTLADMDFVEKIAEVATPQMTFCVSLHGDNPKTHDSLVGRPESFEKTETGLYNLARKGIRTEIRHVVTRTNYRRLPRMARHLYNYFPFAAHYAFMAMEMHGEALKNAGEVMINPAEYREELAEAALAMERGGLPVSLYNVPLCMADKRVRHLARQSISGWKNIFPDKCGNCARKSECCGFFATSETIPLADINPL